MYSLEGVSCPPGSAMDKKTPLLHIGVTGGYNYLVVNGKAKLTPLKLFIY